MVGTAVEPQIRKSSRKPAPKKMSDDFIDIPASPKRKYTKKSDLLKEEIKDVTLLTPQQSIEPQKFVPSLAVQKLRAIKSAAPNTQPTTAMLKQCMSDAPVEEIALAKKIVAKIEVESPGEFIKFVEPKIEMLPETKPETLNQNDLVRRVPSKIAIHTGLRNTFAHSEPLVSRSTHPHQRAQPILRKVIIKPLYNQRNPINLKMVKPEDIVGKMNDHRHPSPMDTGVGRLTLHKISNFGKPPVSNPVFAKPNVVRPMISDKPKNMSSYSTKLVVRPKFVYDVNAKSVVPQELADFSAETELKRIKLEPGEVTYQMMPPETEEPIITFQSIFGKKYQGIPLANAFSTYRKETLSGTNPALAARLAQIINYKKPAVTPKVELKYSDDFPEILRPIGDSSYDPRKRPLSYTPFVPSASDQPRPSGPVSVDIDSLNSHEQSVTCALNNTYRKSVRVTFNGLTQDVPDEIDCHLCGCAMRLCMRKSKYRGEVREYPAYRCLRKGCQTFRAIRKIIEPDYAVKRMLPPCVNKEQDRMFNPDYFLNSLMEMPESRKKAYSEEIMKEVEEVVNKKDNVVVKVEVEDEQEQEQEQEEDVEWRDIGNLQTIVKTEPIEIKKEEPYQGLGEYGSEHDSSESNGQYPGMEDDDCFEVEDDTID